MALVGGRSQGGSRAAASHTGALATERRVLDAFFERVGIWQVHGVKELVAASELYLQDWQPTGDRLAVVSNSGAVCVLAADAAEDAAYRSPSWPRRPSTRLKAELPAFAATGNPVDVTAALLTDSSIFGRVLPILGADPEVDACLLGIPVAGRGYDVEQFARDAAAFAASGTPLVLAVPQPNVAKPFIDAAACRSSRRRPVPIAALSQYLAHRRRMARADALPRPAVGAAIAPIDPRQLNEADSLGRPGRARRAGRGARAGGHGRRRGRGRSTGWDAEQVVVKGCSSETSHKSELGLVRLARGSAARGRAAAAGDRRLRRAHGVALDGFLVAPMVRGLHEALVGASLDPVFGPVMLLGAGGVYVEAVPDTQVLLAPCTVEEVHEAIARLRMAPLVGGRARRTGIRRRRLGQGRGARLGGAGRPRLPDRRLRRQPADAARRTAWSPSTRWCCAGSRRSRPPRPARIAATRASSVDRRRQVGQVRRGHRHPGDLPDLMRGRVRHAELAQRDGQADLAQEAPQVVDVVARALLRSAGRAWPRRRAVHAGRPRAPRACISPRVREWASDRPPFSNPRPLSRTTASTSASRSSVTSPRSQAARPATACARSAA